MKSIDFILCVGKLVVEKLQTTVIGIENFSIFQPFMPQNYRLVHLLQGINKNLFLCGGILDSKTITFVPCVEVLKVRECQKSVTFDKLLFSNSNFIIDTSLIHTIKVAVEKLLLRAV